jgi:hypothetical protein
VLGFLQVTGAKHFDTDFSATLRGQLYGSLCSRSPGATPWRCRTQT